MLKYIDNSWNHCVSSLREVVTQAATNFSNWTIYIYMHGPMFNIGNTTVVGFAPPNYQTADIIRNKIPDSRNLPSCKICCVSIFTPDNCCLPASNIFAII